MSGILDQIRQSSQFSPTTVEEFLALQLSKRLSDEAAIVRYLHYVAHYSVEHLLDLFQRAKQEPDPARAFHSSLTPPET
jgi:hypothetical protein